MRASLTLILETVLRLSVNMLSICPESVPDSGSKLNCRGGMLLRGIALAFPFPFEVNSSGISSSEVGGVGEDREFGVRKISGDEVLTPEDPSFLSLEGSESESESCTTRPRVRWRAGPISGVEGLDNLDFDSDGEGERLEERPEASSIADCSGDAFGLLRTSFSSFRPALLISSPAPGELKGDSAFCCSVSESILSLKPENYNITFEHKVYQ